MSKKNWLFVMMAGLLGITNVPAQTGTLRVDIVPPEAVTEGAQWRLPEGDWQDSGAEIEASVGGHALEFKELDGWNAPARSAVILEDELTVVEAVYSITPCLPGGAAITDDFEDRTDSFAPWEAFSYGQFDAPSIEEQGISTGVVHTGEQSAFLSANNPLPGGWSGFGLRFSHGSTWALPVASMWSNVVFSAAVNETNGRPGNITLRLTDSAGRNLSYTVQREVQEEESEGGGGEEEDGWQEISADLSQFNPDSGFNSSVIQYASVMFESGTNTGAFSAFFDDISLVCRSEKTSGSLRVVIEPATAVEAGAQWRVPGGPWKNGGTELGVVIGEYNLDFRAPAGWAAPARRMAVVSNGATTEVAVTFSEVVCLSPGATIMDDFEDREGGGNILPWVVYGEGGTTIYDQGISTNFCFSGNQSAYFKAILDWSGANFSFEQEFDVPWSLPPTSQWAEIVCTFAFMETNGVSGWLDFSLHDENGRRLYNGFRQNGTSWLAHSNRLSNFNMESGFDPTRVKSVSIDSSSSFYAANNRLSAFLDDINFYCLQDGGHLRVDIEPPMAVGDGARWRLAGGSWEESGTEVALSMGSHTVEFGEIVGWQAPSNHMVNAMPEGYYAITGVYEWVGAGTLQVDIEPPEAVTAGAQWRVTGGDWQDSGEEIAVTAGEYRLEFKPMPGWSAPSPQRVEILDGGAMVVEAVYTVALCLPAGATLLDDFEDRAEIAPWVVSGESGATVYEEGISTEISYSGNQSAYVKAVFNGYGGFKLEKTYDIPWSLPPTSQWPDIVCSFAYMETNGVPGYVYTIFKDDNGRKLSREFWLNSGTWQLVSNRLSQFTAEEGFDPMRIQSVSLVSEYFVFSESRYSVFLDDIFFYCLSDGGHLRVDIEPPMAVGDGARWRLAGGSWEESGTEVALSMGSHTVEFGEIVGWQAPSNHMVNAMPEGYYAITGVYEWVGAGTLQVDIEPPEAVTAGAQWRVTGGDWQDSGEEIEVSAGMHQLEFKRISGWRATAQEVEITDGASETFTATYQEEQFLVLPPKSQWTATASSMEHASFLPAYAIDDNMSTRWNSAWTNNQWLAIDFGQEATVWSVTLHWEAAYARDYTIDLSLDGLDWETVYEGNDHTGGVEKIEFPMSNARHMRISCINRPFETWGFSLWEVDVNAFQKVFPQLFLMRYQETARPPFYEWGATTMQLVADNLWNVDVEFQEPGVEFVFDVYGDVRRQYYGDNEGDGIADLFGERISISEGAGTYRIRLNDSTLAYSIEQQIPGTGTVRVVLEPEAAREAGARWRLTGGEWLESGVERLLLEGSHTIEFSHAAGYRSPSGRAVQVEADLTNEVTGVYEWEGSGTLRVDILPQAVVASGAQWRVTGGEWQESGAEIEVTAGEYALQFSAVPGWTAPTLNATIETGRESIVAAFYTRGEIQPDPGSLTGYRQRVGDTVLFNVVGRLSGIIWGTDVYTDDSTLAVAAVHAGVLSNGQAGIVRASILGPQSSFTGSMRHGVQSSSYGSYPGSYSVEAVGPASQGGLKVLLTGGTETARWRLSGGNWLDSGLALTLPSGDHAIEFKDVLGYRSPSGRVVQVASDVTNEVTGVYELVGTGMLRVDIEPPEAVSAGAQWRLPGGEWQESGAEIEATAGEHALQFSIMSGWTPPTLSVQVEVGATTITQAVYEVALCLPGGAAIRDGFEDRADGRMAPWEVFSYGERAEPVILQEGVSSEQAHTGTHSAFMRVDNTQSGYYSGFGIGYDYDEIWSLPEASQWSNIVFSATIMVAGAEGHLGEIRLTLGDAQGRSYQYAMRVYDSGWHYVSANLSQFASPEWDPGFDPGQVQSLSVFWHVDGDWGQYSVYFDDISFYCLQDGGYLRVDLAPPEAVAAGAQWRVTGGDWQNSGSQLYVTAGSYPVEFSEVSGWNKPADQVVQVTADQTNILAGTYTLEGSGSLLVELTPAHAAERGFWRVRGGEWQASGFEVVLPVGDYDLEFMPLPGWLTPADRAVSIGGGEQEQVQADYTDTVVVSPSAGSWTGGYPVIISGANLSDGANVTNVVLCGVNASSIVSQSSTQIVFVAAEVNVPGLGNLEVHSATYGVWGRSNQFRYVGSQTISFPAIDDQFVSGQVGLAATASSGLPVSFALLPGSPAALSGGTNLSFTGPGEVAVVASQTGDENWEAAPVVTNRFSVHEGTVAQVYLSALSQQYDGTPRIVTATTEPPGLTVEITYAGSANPPVNAGTYAVTGRVVEVGYAGVASAELTVDKAVPLVSAWPVASDIMRGQKLSAARLSGGTASVPGDFSFENGEFHPDVGEADYPAMFTPDDTPNHEIVVGLIRVNVQKRNISLMGTMLILMGE